MQTPQIQSLNNAINKFCATGHLTSLGLTSLICKIKLLQEGSSNSIWRNLDAYSSESETLGNLKITIAWVPPPEIPVTPVYSQGWNHSLLSHFVEYNWE